MFYDTLKKLCEEKTISPSKAATECGISRSTVTWWKQHKTNPNSEQVSKLAEYFGVSTDYLLGRTDGSPEKMCVPYRNIRKFLGKSAKEMAEFLGRDLTTVYEWEQLSKTPDKESLAKIAKALGISLKLLLGKEPNKTLTIEDDGTFRISESLKMPDVKIELIDGNPCLFPANATDEQIQKVIEQKKAAKQSATPVNEQKEKPSSGEEGLSDMDTEVLRRFRSLNENGQKLALAQLDAMLSVQEESSKK